MPAFLQFILQSRVTDDKRMVGMAFQCKVYAVEVTWRKNTMIESLESKRQAIAIYNKFVKEAQ